MNSDHLLVIASRFTGGPSAIALLCPEILNGERPILCVTRKDHVWQFLCGADHSRGHVYEGDADPRIVTVREVVERDPTVADLATLNDHHVAWRERVGAPWVPDDDLSCWWF